MIEGYAQGDRKVRLFYRRVGRSDDVTVFLHGGPGLHIGDGGHEMEPLAKQRSLIMYDQRGGGRSELVTDPHRLSASDHVRDLEAVRQHFDLERMSLVGLSWGAALAVLYAAEYPQRAERLLLLSPMPPARSPYLADRVKAVDQVVGTLGVARMNEIKKLLPKASDQDAKLLCREWFNISSRPYLADPDSFADERADRMCDAPAASLRNRFVVASAAIGSLGDWDFRSLLARLRMPALIVEGARTNVPLEATRVWAAAMPNGRLFLVPDAGHAHFIERPAEFLRAAETFLGGDFPPEAEIVRAVAEV